VLDLGAVLGGTQSAVLQLGRALEDPIRGVTALRRAGVSFTQNQKDQINKLVKSNQLRKAQAIVLDTIRGQLGGVARAMASTPTGKLLQMENTLGDMKEELGKEILPLTLEWNQALINAQKPLLEIVGLVRSWAEVAASIAAPEMPEAPEGKVGFGTKIARGTRIAMLQLSELSAKSGIPAAIFGQSWEDAEIQAQAVRNEIKRLQDDWGETDVPAVEATEESLKRLQKHAREGSLEARQALFKLGIAYSGLAEQVDPAVQKIQEAFDALDVPTTKAPDVPTTKAPDVPTTKAPDVPTTKAPDVPTTEVKISPAIARELLSIFGSAEQAAGALGKFHKSLDELKPPREKLATLHAQLTGLVRAGRMTRTQMLSLFRVAWKDSPFAGPSRELSKLREKAFALEHGLTDAQKELRRFKLMEGVTDKHVREFERFQGVIADAEKALAWEDKAATLKLELKTTLGGSIDEARDKIHEIQEMLNRKLISPEQADEARAMIAEGLQAQIQMEQKAPIMEGGRFGFADFGKSLQDSILRQKDPAKKADEEAKKTAKNTADANLLLTEIRDLTGKNLGTANYG